MLVIYLLSRAVLGPGEITRHRVLGAIALYLTLGMAFAGAYRLSSELIPGSLANVASDAPLPQQYSVMLYFSFVTLKHLVLARIEQRPPRLDLARYPYLPAAEVKTGGGRLPLCWGIATS